MQIINWLSLHVEVVVINSIMLFIQNVTECKCFVKAMRLFAVAWFAQCVSEWEML